MALFIIRIELHSNRPGAYDALHRQMLGLGLGHTVVAGNGSTYALPPAEYLHNGDESVEMVRDSLGSHIAPIDSKYAIVVMKVEQCAWYGLQKIA